LGGLSGHIFFDAPRRVDSPAFRRYDGIIQNDSEEMMRPKYIFFLTAAMLLLLGLAGCGPDISAPSTPAPSPAVTPAASVAAPPDTLPPDTLPPDTLPAIDEPTPAAAAEAGYDVGNAMPDFSVPLAGDGTFTLSEHLGKPVFINIFATWCPPCVAEMPEIDRLYGELSDQVSFIVIDLGEDEATAQGFAADNGYSLPFAYSLDGAPFGAGHIINYIPETFVLGPDGVITAHYNEGKDYDAFKAALEAALSR
jgi:thiol-disulfide isomerase/thioredoxin